MVNSLMMTPMMNDCIVPEKAYILGCRSLQGSFFFGAREFRLSGRIRFTRVVFLLRSSGCFGEKFACKKRRTSRIERDGQLIPIALHAWADGKNLF
jgi:hypothetical protein